MYIFNRASFINKLQWARFFYFYKYFISCYIKYHEKQLENYIHQIPITYYSLVKINVKLQIEESYFLLKKNSKRQIFMFANKLMDDLYIR